MGAWDARGLLTVYDHANIPNIDKAMTAETAHNQSVPWLLIWRSAFGGLVSIEPMI